MLSVPDRTPDQPSEDVALSDVGRRDTPLVTQDEGAGPDVVRDDAHRDIGLLVLTVCDARKKADLFEDGLHDFGLVDALLALENGYGALDSHSGVDALALHLHELAFLGLAVAHEDIVPDLEVLAASAAGLAVRSALGASGVYEHLRVRSAGSGLSGRSPPVVLTRHEVNPLIGNSAFVPDLGALFITRDSRLALEDGDGKLLRIDSQLLCQEFITPGNHLLLEVITERPVAQHLEACEVMRIADTVDVSGPDALLVVRQSLSGRMGLAQDVRYQRMHSGRGEKDGRVVLGDDGGAADLSVASGHEEVDEFLSEFISCKWFHNVLDIIYLGVFSQYKRFGSRSRNKRGTVLCVRPKRSDAEIGPKHMPYA